MASGWSKQGSGIPLAQRVRTGVASAVPTPEPYAASDVCPSRHCWVADALDHLGVKRPGLLVEWRQVAAVSSGWEGRVVYAVQLRAGAWQLVEEWVPAELLTPA